MDTPIYDFLRNYNDSGMLRCHMPGHKGRGDKLSFGLDITEIHGADSLFESDGIISRSEQNMARLYDSAATVYSAGGSTLCIQTMLAIMKSEWRTVIAVRNVHRAFLNAAALLDLDVRWLMPDYRNGILSGDIELADVEKMLRSTPNACLYVTSPDYTGHTADIAALAEICRKYGAPLLVDNAHGAHMRFFEESRHPINLGADMCCDSAHKMLPALTGAAMLHASGERYGALLKQYMSLFGSTSPSYLIMASLDLCCRYADEEIRRDIADNLRYIAEFCSRFGGLSFMEGEPFHITINAAESGFDGDELARMLRRNGAECEYSDPWTVILLMSPMNREEDYERLANSLEAAMSAAERRTRILPEFRPVLPSRAMSIRDAVFSPSETIPVESAEGRVCAAVKVPCPPAIPIAASGEIIDRNCINIFKTYGISDVNVVK